MFTLQKVFERCAREVHKKIDFVGVDNRDFYGITPYLARSRSRTASLFEERSLEMTKVHFCRSRSSLRLTTVICNQYRYTWKVDSSLFCERNGFEHVVYAPPTNIIDALGPNFVEPFPIISSDYSRIRFVYGILYKRKTDYNFLSCSKRGSFNLTFLTFDERKKCIRSF
jgi:hypothetical protein